jgi:hypothetical protein
MSYLKILLMNIFLRIATLVFALNLLLVGNGLAQKYTLSGYVKDAKNGEALIGVNVFIKNTSTGTASNSYGFYSLSAIPGSYHLMVSYVGYKVIDTLVNLSSDITMNFELAEKINMINEVVIQSKNSRENVESTTMSAVFLTRKAIKQIPVSYGEPDILKVLTLLPGVKTNDEGGSISVRGGARDQNMIMLDEATVYNASHLGNLLSVFNNDAIQSVEFYKGNIPAQYGGRLSSLIDIRMKEGNNKQFSATGGIGTLASRLTLEGPIVKDKGSFMISGRRTYIDLFTRVMHAIKDTIPVTPYYFYDLNLKANYSLNARNKLFVSGYFGKDVFSSTDTVAKINNDFAWGNYTGTLRWNYIISNKIFTNLTLLASNYNYDFKNAWTYGKEMKQNVFEWTSFLKDYSLKYDVGYYMNDKITIKTGFISTYHDIDLGKVNGRQDTLRFKFAMPNNYSLEHALYLACEQKFTSNLSVNYGLRYTLFQSLGKATVYKLNSDYNIIDTVKYGKNKIFNHYQTIEPRIGITYMLNDNSSVKAAYSRTSQYMHIVSNSSIGSLMDIWVGSNSNIKPESANVYSAGFFKNFLDNKIETSIEVYYKDMKNQVSFKEFAQPEFDQRIDEDFRFGIGRSYGAEFFIRKSEGRLNGWISYTYSKTEQKTEGIQQKGWYLSAFDRPHDLSIVGMYDLSKRFSVSANFTLKSGEPFTSPALKYEYEQTVIPYFEKLNNDRMPLYHRLDLSISFRSKEKPGRKFRSELVLSVIDVYNRKNASAIYFKSDDDNERITKAYQETLLTITPSLTWNFSF